MTESNVDESPVSGAPFEEPERRREPIFNLPVSVLVIIAACAILHLLRLYVLSIDQDIWLLIHAAFIPIRYSGQFDLDLAAFTSPVTYAFLHGSIAHLVINMIWLGAFGSPLANRLGVARFALFFAVTAIAAAALHYVLHAYDQAPLVGASGAISGMMGAAARFGFQIDRSDRRPRFAGWPLPVLFCLRLRPVVTFLAVWMVINLVTGLLGFGAGSDISIAWEAHVGGFLAGFLGVGYFVGRPKRRQENEPVDEIDEES